MRWAACTLLLIFFYATAVAYQGPGGEVMFRPPPVDEGAADRAREAAIRRRQAAIADQAELALKNGNAALERFRGQQGMGGSDSARQEALGEAETSYQRAAKLRPRDWRPFSGLGDVYYWQSRYDDSETAFNRAIALRPNDTNLKKYLARTYNAQYGKIPESATAERRRKRDHEIRLLEQILLIDPSVKEEDTYFDLWESYASLKEYDKAVSTLKRLIAVLPPSDRGGKARQYSFMANVYEDAGRFQEAVDAFKQAIRFQPDDGDHYMSMGRAYVGAKRYSEAIAAFEEAKKHNLTSRALPDLRIGETYLEAKDYTKAIGPLQSAARLEPNNWEPLASMGLAYYEQKQYQQSIDALQQSVARSSTIPGTHYYLGLNYVALGNKAQAMQEYEQLKTMKSDFAEKSVTEIN